jgi:hypothetical protein
MCDEVLRPIGGLVRRGNMGVPPIHNRRDEVTHSAHPPLDMNLTLR